jgi:hypothetical protein
LHEDCPISAYVQLGPAAKYPNQLISLHSNNNKQHNNQSVSAKGRPNFIHALLFYITFTNVHSQGAMNT